jgi:hypothetical protein
MTFLFNLNRYRFHNEDLKMALSPGLLQEQDFPGSSLLQSASRTSEELPSGEQAGEDCKIF